MTVKSEKGGWRREKHFLTSLLLNLSISMELYFSDILLYLDVVLLTCCQAWSKSIL